MTEYTKKSGVPTEYNAIGQPLIRSDAHQAALGKLFGCVNRSRYKSGRTLGG